MISVLARRGLTWILLAIVAGALLFGWAHGQPSTLVGPVRVIDGDTIVLTNSNTHVRLNGVDALEVVHPNYDQGSDVRDLVDVHGQAARAGMA